MTAARPLDRAEAFFWFLDRVSSMNFAVLAEGEGPLDAGSLDAALAAVQRAHPLLRAAIVAGPGGPLAFAPAEGKAIALAESSLSPEAALAEALARPFELGEAPLVRALVARGEGGRWTFALVFHHSIADARSAFTALRQVLEVATGAAAPPAPQVAPPPLMALFPESLRGEAAVPAAQAWKAALKAAGTRPADLAGFVRTEGPIRPVVTAIRFDEGVADALAAKARATDTTVHGLLGAAQLLAAHEVLEAGDDATMLLTSPADLRAHLATRQDHGTPAFGVTLVTSGARVGPGGDAAALARHLAKDLRRQIAAGYGHLFYALTAAAETLPPVPQAIDGFRAYLSRMPTAFVLSNAGRVPSVAAGADLRVDRLSFALCPMGHQPLFYSATTADGRLTVHAVHDEARLEGGRAAAIAEGFRERVLAAAG
mgnify:CR=1 FL=1